ncbi:MAG: thioredoxin [Thermoleophilia bacterium]|nr:thioredoxin [Thermoleophilia bacterium]
MGLSQVTDATFAADVEQSDVPVLVDFWAEWCGPCRMMNPILEEFAAAHDGQMKVVKLNVDENPEAASRFKVLSIPTMLVFQNGDVVKQMVGAMSRQRLDEALAEWVGATA